MTIGRYMIWICLAVFLCGIITIAQYPVRKKCSYVVRIIIIIGKSFAAIMAAYICVATDTWIAWNGAFFVASLYAVLIGDIIADVIMLPYIIKKKAKGCHKVQTAMSAVCVFLFLLYGTINMQLVHANHFTLTSEKLQGDYKIVFLSDIHVGSAQSMETVAGTISSVKTEKPDYFILCGDITDEYTTKDEMHQSLNSLGI